MNAALEARLEGGGYLLVTAAEDSLPWTRSDRYGWGVGVYQGEDDQDHLAYDCTPQGSTEALFELVRRVLRAAGSSGREKGAARSAGAAPCEAVPVPEDLPWSIRCALPLPKEPGALDNGLEVSIVEFLRSRSENRCHIGGRRLLRHRRWQAPDHRPTVPLRLRPHVSSVIAVLRRGPSHAHRRPGGTPGAAGEAGAHRPTDAGTAGSVALTRPSPARSRDRLSAPATSPTADPAARC